VHSEKAFTSLMEKAIIHYHQHKDEALLYNFFVVNNCTSEQATQLTGIAINDYEEYITKKRNAMAQILMGLTMAVGGSIVTFYSWLHPFGTTSFIFWGVIVVGISVLINGCITLPKKNLLKYTS
jgi:hypothetical protein